MAKDPVILSIDDGYHDNKMTDGTVKELIPSYATKWKEPRQSDLELDEKGDIKPLSYIKAETDGRSWLVGRGAIQQDTSGSWIGGPNKHANKLFKVIFRTCLAIITPKDRDVVDLLNMNLPVEAEEDPERVEALRNLVIGWHKIKVTLADQTVIEREINVKDVYIKNQPFAAYCSIVLDKNGDFADRELAAGFNILGDIGARTFNKYAWEAMVPMLDLKDQSYEGMFKAYGAIGEEITRLSGTKVPDIRVPLILERGEMNGVTAAQLEKIKEDAYDDHANKLVSDMEKALVDVQGQVHNVIWGCGGAEVLQPYIERYMVNYKLRFLNRFSVCMGGYNIAKRVYNKQNPKPAPAKKSEKETAASSEVVQS